MSKAVLITCPHTNIVSAMEYFLEEGRFHTDKLEHFSGLSSRDSVIAESINSLALSSLIIKTVGEVFLKLKSVAFGFPIAFGVQLGWSETFLYPGKDGPTSPERCNIGTRLIQRHFR